ncbi:hypothetical protein ACFCWG_11245 [Streptomyces sp. NPDC056390]|uniref:hypothetical protein n=1 Tax=Streptomyces sp. NPDC056390 TaxID=3345806 RepID=UPI0035E350EF
MTEYSWPDDSRAGRARDAWATTVEDLPIGTRVTCEVIARQPFGVFVQIDAVPEAIGLIEITAMPRGAVLPVPGKRLSGNVIGHAEHNHQVRVRLSESANTN